MAVLGFRKNVFGCCYIYIQTVKLALTRRFSFVNLFAFVCELVCIYMWIFAISSHCRRKWAFSCGGGSRLRRLERPLLILRRLSR